MSTIKSSAEDLILNADGASSEVRIQQNGTTAITISAGDIQLKSSAEANSLETAIHSYNTDQVQNNSGIEFWTDAYQNTGTIKLKTSYGSTYSDKLIIDSSGRVTMPSQPAFTTRGSGGWISLSSGGQQINTWASPSSQKGGTNFSSSTGKFTAPVTGWYMFIFGTYTRVGNSSSYILPRLYKNGSSVPFDGHITHYQGAGEGDTGHTLTVLLDLSGNDYVQAGYYLSGSGDYHAGSQSLQGHLLS